MSAIKKLPTGIGNFEKLRSDNEVDVDETQQVCQLIRRRRSYFTARLRRLGKSMILPASKPFFEGKKHLFGALCRKNERTKCSDIYIDFIENCMKKRYKKLKLCPKN
ncbi:MAG: AAA family ATPase [Prevotellaceae bacterium]|jgi:hypothetical protein|nr:AAA family ATPase [Prevotellaceae bacterium]